MNTRNILNKLNSNRAVLLIFALLLASRGARVRYVTSGSRAGEWSKYTGEQDRTQRQMLEAGIEIRCNETLASFDGREITLNCVYTGSAAVQAASALVLVTSREPNDNLYYELVGSEGAQSGARILRIGDCLQPSIIAAAVYSGHKAARELGSVAPSVALRDRVPIQK
jgi:dimethylamine/trimethylamine dehydrogenase